MCKTIGENSLILICGVGSIGERHINNLLDLGYKNIILYRKKNKAFRTLKKKFPTFSNIDDALKEKPEISFITNPTSIHIDTAIKCASSGSHIFIEKPLSNNKKGIKKLNSILKKNNKKVMIGYMLRFHPCFIKIKELFDNHKIGNILSTISIWGEFLPSWHPWEDYAASYAGKKDLGGGPALTLSHDIDILLWLIGKPVSLKSFANYSSKLNIDTEHSIDILLKYKEGIISNIHLDYLQKPPIREYFFIGDKGRIIFDYYKNKITLNMEGSNEKIISPGGFDRNDMFKKEVEYFIDCINNNKNPSPGINEASVSIDIATKAIKSDKHKKGIKIC